MPLFVKLLEVRKEFRRENFPAWCLSDILFAMEVDAAAITRYIETSMLSNPSLATELLLILDNPEDLKSADHCDEKDIMNDTYGWPSDASLSRIRVQGALTRALSLQVPPTVLRRLIDFFVEHDTARHAQFNENEYKYHYEDYLHDEEDKLCLRCDIQGGKHFTVVN